MSGVESIEFWFFDGLQWLDTWDSTQQPTKLPVAIRMNLQLVTPEEIDLPQGLPPVELLVPLMAQASTNQTEQASGGTGGQP